MQKSCNPIFPVIGKQYASSLLNLPPDTWTLEKLRDTIFLYPPVNNGQCIFFEANVKSLSRSK